MRFLVTALLALLIASQAFAQNAQIPEEPLKPAAPTITLDAKVVQIVLNDEHRQGVDWEAIVSDFHSLQLKRQDNPIWVDKKYRLSIGEVSNEDYEVLLDALDTVGRVSQNNFIQTILQKDETKTADVSFDPKTMPSILLDLRWFNSPAGGAKLKVEPAVGVILKDSSKPTTAVILKSETAVDLKDNTTLVIGGLMREEEITKTHKFPLLGDLPLVGLVFRKQGRLMQKTETIVFLTMHTAAVQMPDDEQK